MDEQLRAMLYENRMAEQTERITSLEADLLTAQDQVGGLTSELGKLRDVYTATAELLQIREEQVQQLLKDVSDSQQQLTASQAEVTALRTEHLWAKRLINCWWTAEQSLFNDVANPEGFEKLEGKTAVAIERWKEATKAAEDALLATPSAAAERVRLLEEVAKAAKLYLFTDYSIGGEAYLKESDLRDALAALDAATAKETLTVEEVTS